MAETSAERLDRLELALGVATKALQGAKRDLMHQRRFGTDTYGGWRNAGCAVEGDVEEALQEVKAIQNPANTLESVPCDASA